MTQVTTTSEEFMPSIFRMIYARVSSVHIHLNQMNSLSVEIKMRLFGNPVLREQAYVKEGWKTMQLIKVLKENHINDVEVPVPLLVFRPQQWLRISPETLRLEIEGSEQVIAMSDRHQMIGTPDSDAPPSSNGVGHLLEPEPRGTYSYYGGKLSSIYGPLQLNKEYTFSFEVEAVNPMYSLDFFFPYRYVDVESITVAETPGIGVHAAGPVYLIAKPMVSSKLTPEYEYKINKPDGEYPKFKKAEPFRDTPPIISKEQPVVGQINERTHYPLMLDDYKILSVQFQFAFSNRDLPHNLIVQPKVTDRAIPIRTYEQMQRLPEYRDFLVQFDLFNTDSQRERQLIVESEISGYTERVSEVVVIPRLGSNQAARKVIKQCPPLKSGILQAMIGPMNAELEYKVYEVTDGSKELVASGSKTVRLLSNEQIVWSLNDVTSGATYNLEPTLASWIEPYDKNGRLEEVRQAANKHHAGGKLRGNTDGEATLEDIRLDVKALYDCLNKDYGISYGDHPTNYGFHHEPHTAQRILTGPQVLERKNGVCIDFVILFASLMEGLGINPLLILDQNHAFLGWGNHKDRDAKIDDMGFLETTKLGERNDDGTFISFEVAEKLAKDYFRKNFMFTNDSSVLMGLQTRFGKVLVDLKDARDEGAVRI